MNRSRRNAEKCEDIELRLAPSFPSKERSLAFLRGPPEFIVIEDDDDDEEEGQDQALAPNSSTEIRRFIPCPSSSVPGIREGDLDLRLGIGASTGSSANTNGWNMYPRKCREAARKHFTQEFTEVKLRCAICMDTMKEETSTLCGHIFCKSCITNSILALKRCPTCRTELSISSIHRIFLPGATS